MQNVSEHISIDKILHLKAAYKATFHCVDIYCMDVDVFILMKLQIRIVIKLHIIGRGRLAALQLDEKATIACFKILII